MIHCPVIAVGEGAGANVVARFALSNPKRLHGAVLIHCTSTTAGFLESMKDKVSGNVPCGIFVTPDSMKPGGWDPKYWPQFC